MGEKDKNEQQMDVSYDKTATAYCKEAMFFWCLAGGLYAAITWRLLWLPGLLIFFPGIFIASLITALFFIPFRLIAKKAKTDWENFGNRRWGLLVTATVLKGGVYLAPVVGAVLYVHFLRELIK